MVRLSCSFVGFILDGVGNFYFMVLMVITYGIIIHLGVIANGEDNY